MIPKDLRNNFEGKDEFRLSLIYVINEKTRFQFLNQVLFLRMQWMVVSP